MAIRKSSFRHVRAEPTKKELYWLGVKCSQSSWDSNKASVSSKFCAVIWQIGGGGAVGVVNIASPYRIDSNPSLIVGHSAPVTDCQFSPFNPYLLATTADDGTAKLWNIPEGGLTENMSEPIVTLNGHTHKVGCCRWNPVAEHILATAGQDQCVKIWNVAAPECVKTITFEAYPTTMEWSPDGKYLFVACKDKKARIIDPREEKVVAEWCAHGSLRPFRGCWVADDRFITIGHTGQSRELRFWNLADVIANGEGVSPIHELEVDRVSSTCVPMFDFGTKILFLAGKGDSSVTYFELVDEAPYCYPLSAYTATEPQLCCVPFPKHSCDVLKTEIFRMMKIGRDHMEILPFVAPRRVAGFHADIFPDVPGPKPSMTNDEWLAGENKPAVLVSMRPDGAEDATAVAAAFVPAATETKKESIEEKVARLEAENKQLRMEIATLRAKLA